MRRKSQIPKSKSQRWANKSGTPKLARSEKSRGGQINCRHGGLGFTFRFRWQYNLSYGFGRR